jgi:hypothetical protein
LIFKNAILVQGSSKKILSGKERERRGRQGGAPALEMWIVDTGPEESAGGRSKDRSHELAQRKGKE